MPLSDWDAAHLLLEAPTIRERIGHCYAPDGSLDLDELLAASEPWSDSERLLVRMAVDILAPDNPTPVTLRELLHASLDSENRERFRLAVQGTGAFRDWPVGHSPSQAMG